MNVYDILARRWGLTPEAAKVRAFGAMYGTTRINGKVFRSQFERDIEAAYKEIQENHMETVTDVLSKSDHLKSLGSQGTTYTYNGPSKELLETFPNPMLDLPEGATGTIEIDAPEFTSLCPKTGQPDFARIIVEYQPNELCVESKSWKLYLGSFRQAGEFHEACITRMAKDLVELLDPKWLTIKGEFTPRGGISFWPTVDYSRPYVEEDVKAEEFFA